MFTIELSSNPKITRLLELDSTLEALASCRMKAADDIKEAESIDCTHREFDQERQDIRARLTPAEDVEYELARHAAH